MYSISPTEREDMMNFKFHFLSSLAVASTVPIISYYSGYPMAPKTIAAVIPAIVIGANLNDIDTESKPSRYYARLGILISAIWLWMGNYDHVIMLWIPFVFAKADVHRGWTHSKIALPVILATLPVTVGVFSSLSAAFFNYDMTAIKNLIIQNALFFPPFAFGFCVHNFIDGKWFKKLVLKMGFTKKK